MLDGGIQDGGRINMDGRAVLVEVSHEPIERERNAIGDVVVCAREQRDAHASNIHIIRLVTYRGPRYRNLAPPGRQLSS